MPRNVVAIGKCAGALLVGVAEVLDVESAFVAMPGERASRPPTGGGRDARSPHVYKLPNTKAEVHHGGHPQMTRASFEAGRALLRFVDAHRDILFLVSGGGSAC